jgi:hypothetical protein
LSTLIDDLAFSDRSLNESAVRDTLEFLRRINKHLDVATPNALMEIGQDPVKAIKIALVGLLNQDEIDITLVRLSPLCEGSEQDGLPDVVFLKYGPASCDDAVDSVNVTLHANACGSEVANGRTDSLLAFIPLIYGIEILE